MQAKGAGRGTAPPTTAFPATVATSPTPPPAPTTRSKATSSQCGEKQVPATKTQPAKPNMPIKVPSHVPGCNAPPALVAVFTCLDTMAPDPEPPPPNQLQYRPRHPQSLQAQAQDFFDMHVPDYVNAPPQTVPPLPPARARQLWKRTLRRSRSPDDAPALTAALPPADDPRPEPNGCCLDSRHVAVPDPLVRCNWMAAGTASELSSASLRRATQTRARGTTQQSVLDAALIRTVLLVLSGYKKVGTSAVALAAADPVNAEHAVRDVRDNVYARSARALLDARWTTWRLGNVSDTVSRGDLRHVRAEGWALVQRDWGALFPELLAAASLTLPIQRGLDVGAGAGGVSEPLRDVCRSLIAVETSRAMEPRARDMV
ncbi:unnamed protein product [Symbiodinium necroappetens]|uniref:Uncharacterized protein n=1 Tax=Symbiodinium necroappetens TaxID=1628268 RepID=A0A813CNQ9_9DINO|nr:unnamed protein product [Symbiodinium necroappetens]